MLNRVGGATVVAKLLRPASVVRPWLLGATVAVLLLGACSPGGGELASPVTSGPVRPPPSTAAPIPTPSPSPSAEAVPSAPASFPAELTTADVESAAIIEGWQAYWRVYEKFSADPSLTDLTETQYVTTGEEANLVLDRLSLLKAAGLVNRGGLVFRNIEVAQASDEVPAQATLTYCVDINSLLVIEQDTGRQVDRRGTWREHATLEQGEDGVWRVAQIRNEEATC